MPQLRATPGEYDIYINDKGYLKPSPDVMFNIRDFWFVRDSLDWFPQRQQGEAISEAQLPPRSERPHTVKDRSGGFGWSDWDTALDARENMPGVYAYTDAVDAGTAGDGQGVDCSVEGVAFLGPQMNQVSAPAGTGEMRGHFELTIGGTRYAFVVVGTKLYQSSDGSGWSTLIPGTGSTMPSLAAPLTGTPRVFQGTQNAPLVYFPQGSGALTQHWDGTSAGMTNLGAIDTNRMIDCMVVEDAFWGLWLDTTATQTRYRMSKMFDGGANPTWLPSYSVSDKSDPALYILYAHGRLYVACKRHLRTLDDSVSDLEQTIMAVPEDSNNFRWWWVHQDQLWFNTNNGRFRLIPQDSGGTAVALDPVGPETLPNNRTPVRGLIYGGASDDFCSYGFLKNAEGVVYLMKFRKYADGSERWHVILRVGEYTPNYAFITTVGGQPRLVVGLSNTSFATFILPKNGFYPPGDPACTFAEKGYIFDSRQYGDLYFVTKTLLAWTGRAQDVTSTEVVTPYYRYDTPGAFTQWSSGTLTVEPGARIQLDTPVAVQWWENRLKLTRGGTNTLTPKLLASTTSFALRPDAKGLFTVYISVTDFGRTWTGKPDQRSALDLQTELLALDGSKLPVEMVDDLGAVFNVMVDEVRIMRVNRKADERPEAVARVTMTEWAAVVGGTHNALGRYNHDFLGAHTHDELSILI